MHLEPWRFEQVLKYFWENYEFNRSLSNNLYDYNKCEEDECYLHLPPFHVLQLKLQQLEVSLNLGTNRLKSFGHKTTLSQVSFAWNVLVEMCL